MPWLDCQVAILRELGVSWLRAAPAGGALLATPAAPAEPENVDASPAMAAPAAPRIEPSAQAQTRSGRPATVPVTRSSAQDPALDPAASSLITLGWDELRAAVAVCQACSLCQTRTQTVFGVGHEAAQWMVVGEAPGEQEDLKGEPFVGAAGRLLDQMLHALQLSRRRPVPGQAPDATRQVFIANTLKCRPPGNRNPQADELARCEPFLQRQIQLLQPRIILAMGRFAVQSLLRSGEPIGKLRGRVHTYQGVPLVVTYHPAYLLRNPLDKAKAWADLCLAADTFDRGAAAAEPAPDPR